MEIELTSNPFYAVPLAGVVATTVMTLFSHVVSTIRDREFNEPQLLNKFLEGTRFLPGLSNENAIWGWLLHYGIGVVVAGWIYGVFKLFEWEASLGSGGLLGLIAGLVGAVGWLVLFAFHPNAPETDVKEFLMQLLMAHCIFGATAAAVFIFLAV